MAITIGRREFISVLGGAAVAWPNVALAQQPAMPVIGILHPGSPEPNAAFVMAVRKGLDEMGYVEGSNVTIEYRWAQNNFDRLPELVADLVRRRVTVLIVSGPPAAQAAKAATMTIPIVFTLGANPVELGLVASLNRPGGNVTGITSMNVELIPKRLGLLLELVPAAVRFAVLINPNSPNAEPVTKDALASASAIGRQIDVFTAGNIPDIDRVFADLMQKRSDALLVSADPLFADRHVQLVSLAVRYGVPVLYPGRGYTEAGGLMSYGTNATDQNRQAGAYAGHILKGEKPADLPVMQATKFELVINLYTAKLLGITVPASLLAQANDVIE
jgi:putative ABC transport system substrate-binding protein